MKHYNIPVFVPHLGCPHDCVFCNQRKITGHSEALDIKEIKLSIDQVLDDLLSKDEAYIEIAFFGGSFTGIPVEEQVLYLELAHDYLKENLIQGIRLSTRPDYINVDILKRLKQYGVTTIELGVQSLSQKVLDLSKRNHDIHHVNEAVDLIRQYEIEYGLQMMIGLPGDTKELAIHTAKEIAKLCPSQVRIYPTVILKDTELEAMYDHKQYESLTLDEAVDWCVPIVEIFEKHNIKIIRVGLQSTDLLSSDAVVSGPYHPAFRQLVANKRWLMKLRQVLTLNTYDHVEIQVNQKQYSDVVGQKRSNLLILKKELSNTEIIMTQSEKLCQEICVILNKNEKKYLTLSNAINEV